ncbi:hypothetical protein BH11BAC2_BH11BAC2_25960 [soil metagenome]
MNPFFPFRYFLLLGLFFSAQVMAQQEQLVPLNSNPVIKKYILNNPVSTNKILAVDTLDIPFVDDFSGTEVYPDANLWLDKLVFINDDFPRNPFTIGVATFDGLDAYGNAYVNTFSSAQGYCDTLTSKPIFLLTKPASSGGGQYSIGDSITLSFYYEKKGWGDAPDTNDSLLLEFLDPVTTLWSRQWFKVGGVFGGNDTVFSSVQVRITNPAFLADGFQFRFRSYGGQTGSLDQWHLDYVRLYKAYNNFTNQMDTTITDIAYTLPAASLLSGFTSIPWDHFTYLSNPDQQAIIKDSATVNYRVNSSSNEDVGFNNRIYDYVESLVYSFGITNGNIFAGRPKNVNLNYTFPLSGLFPNTPSLTIDSTFFTYKTYFSNLSSAPGIKTNDTVFYKQEFYNYYSYDDGTAEVGYDLVNAPNGKLAMQFDIIKPDTLRAVRFMFLQQNLNVSNKLFTIKIWSSLSPETLIYQETNQKPVYVDTINGFATYVLDQIVPVSGTIYVGFQQVLPDGLHLGFDRNTNSNSKMFYNVNGSWIPVGVATGSFMIRPVMGDTSLFTGISNPEIMANDYLLFPNPTEHYFSIRNADATQVENIVITDLQGKEISKVPFALAFSTVDFIPGIYLVKINQFDGISIVRKLIITQH